jgi:uncharacterized membrane protein
VFYDYFSSQKFQKRFHTTFHYGIHDKEMNEEINYQNFLETLENPNNKINSKEAKELNFSETNNHEVVIKIQDLLVCFVLFTIGLFLTIIVFVIELLIFFKNRI